MPPRSALRQRITIPTILLLAVVTQTSTTTPIEIVPILRIVIEHEACCDSHAMSNEDVVPEVRGVIASGILHQFQNIVKLTPVYAARAQVS